MPEAPLLSVTALKAFYGDFQALYGVDVEVGRGRIVAVIGANGAGKSTLLNTLVGLNAAPREAIRFDGEPIGGEAPYKIVRRGLGAGAGGAAVVSFAERRGEPHHRRAGRPRPARGRWSACSSCSRSSPSDAASLRCRCRAASSRWSPSAGR